jgi:hypothetical protein
MPWQIKAKVGQVLPLTACWLRISLMAISSDDVDKMTPGQLDAAVRKALGEPHPDAEVLQGLARQAWNRIQDLRKAYPFLPNIAASTGNYVADLQEARRWCIEAERIVDALPARMEPKVIRDVIEVIKGLGEMRAPQPDRAVWDRACEQAKQMSPAEGPVCREPELSQDDLKGTLLDGSPLVRDVHELMRVYQKFPQLRQFWRQADQICRSTDRKYAAAFQQFKGQYTQLALQNNTRDATDTGKLLNVYDDLKGLNISCRMKQFGDGPWNYGIDFLVDYMIAGDFADKFWHTQPRMDFISGLVATYEEILSHINEAQALELPADTGKRKTKEQKGQPEKKFRLWDNPGDACFIIDDDRVRFHHGDMTKDLALDHFSRAETLIVMLSKGNLQSKDIKDDLHLKKEKPTQVVQRVNGHLNKKIAGLGFLGIPNNVEFIKYDDRFHHYSCTIQIHPSMADFDKESLKQPSCYDQSDDE